jgi:RNA polymerase-binding transcription factor DksA
MTTHIESLKSKLEEERTQLLEELQKIGRINPDNLSDWEPVAGEINLDTAEEEERAEEITNFEERSAIEFEIEKRWNEVNSALAAIAEGTYGICRTCGEHIDDERLSANPAATTCRLHME